MVDEPVVSRPDTYVDTVTLCTHGELRPVHCPTCGWVLFWTRLEWRFCSQDRATVSVKCKNYRCARRIHGMTLEVIRTDDA